MREHINLVEASTRPAKLETAPLPYAKEDLAPVISAETLEYHYENLAKNYARRYNAGEGNSDFNRAGAFLHDKLFAQYRSPRRGNQPVGAVAELIEKKFKTFDDFKAAVSLEAMKLHGSGWVYLSTGGDIKTIRNHAVRTDIALLFDLWEHAYALDYQWDKQRYLDSVWRIVDWSVINDRL